jgi:hypothetical protein
MADNGNDFNENIINDENEGIVSNINILAIKNFYKIYRR